MLTFREYGGQMIGERLNKMLGLVERVRAGDDIEAIHDMRVASRRLRAAFSVFAAAFPYRRYQEMESEVRNITRALSEARELDVLAEDLSSLAKRINRNERGLIAELEESVRERRMSLDPAVHAALNRLEAIDLREDLAFIAERLPEVDGGSLEEHATATLTERVQALAALGEYADDPSRVLELHEMRIAAKKLRYTMELFAPFRDKWFSGAIESIRTLQDILGNIHDSDVLVPKLLAHTRRELKDGVDPEGVGAQKVDLDGLNGMIRACRLVRMERQERHGRLIVEWQALTASGLLLKITEGAADTADIGPPCNG